MSSEEALFLEGTSEKDTKIVSRKHLLLERCCKGWSDYMAGKMGVDTYGVDCSCGCKYFVELGEDSGDWGICCNRDSPRGGLLTWEHMGCESGFRRNRQ